MSRARRKKKNEAKAKELLTQKTFFGPLLGRVYFDDQLASNAQLLYVVAKHMPQKLKDLVTPAGLKTMLVAADPVVGGQPAFDIVEVLPPRDAAGNATLRGLKVGAGAFPRVGYGDTAVGLRMTNRRELPLFYQVTHAGFDRAPPTTPIKDSIDVTRESMRVLSRVNEVFGAGLEFVEFDWGADKYLKEGIALPAGALGLLP